MIFRPLAEHAPGPTFAQRRRTALNAAVALRNCSLHTQTTVSERTACRYVMRQSALRWQREAEHATPAGAAQPILSSS